jgi:sRNA-binding carbon storage regulator CsrA
MLIRNCKAGDIMIIGDNIRIHILKFMGNGIRLGFEVDRLIPIHCEKPAKKHSSVEPKITDMSESK